jgi:putative addiction module component (TIGR02574 family)
VSSRFEDVKANAAQLSETERADLALFLIESLDGPQEIGFDHAWRIEIEHRLAQIERGEVQLIPGDDVLERLRRRLD